MSATLASPSPTRRPDRTREELLDVIPGAEVDWLQELDAGGTRQEAALRQLRPLIARSLRRALQASPVIGEVHIDDFTQEAMVRILERRRQFRGNSRFTTWAYAVAIRVALTELRRKHWQNVSLDALVEEGGQLADSAALSSDEAEAGDERARVLESFRRAIAESLTERQRTAIVGGLRGLPIDQITAVLGISRNAMYKLFHDARRAIKARLEAEGVSSETIRRTFRS